MLSWCILCLCLMYCPSLLLASCIHWCWCIRWMPISFVSSLYVLSMSVLWFSMSSLYVLSRSYLCPLLDISMSFLWSSEASQWPLNMLPKFFSFLCTHLVFKQERTGICPFCASFAFPYVLMKIMKSVINLHIVCKYKFNILWRQ